MGKGADLLNGAAQPAGGGGGGRGLGLLHSGGTDPGVPDAPASPPEPSAPPFMGSETLGQALYDARDSAPVRYLRRIGESMSDTADEYHRRQAEIPDAPGLRQILTSKPGKHLKDAMNVGLEHATNAIGSFGSATIGPYMEAVGFAGDELNRAGLAPNADDSAFVSELKKMANVPESATQMLGHAAALAENITERGKNTMRHLGVDDRTAENVGDFTLDIMEAGAPFIPAGVSRATRGLRGGSKFAMDALERVPAIARRNAIRAADNVPLRDLPVDVPGARPLDIGAPAAISDWTPAPRAPTPAGKIPEDAMRSFRAADPTVRRFPTATERVDAALADAPTNLDSRVPFYEDAAAPVPTQRFGQRQMEVPAPDAAPVEQLPRAESVLEPEAYRPVPITGSESPALVRTDALATEGMVPMVAPRTDWLPPPGRGQGLRRPKRGEAGMAILPPEATAAQKRRAFERADMPYDSELANRLNEKLWQKPIEAGRMRLDELLTGLGGEKWAWLKERKSRLFHKREGRTNSREFGAEWRKERAGESIAQESGVQLGVAVEKATRDLNVDDLHQVMEAMDARNRGIELSDPELASRLQDGPIAEVMQRISDNQEKLVAGGMLAPDTAEHMRHGYLTRVNTEKRSILSRLRGAPRVRRNRLAHDTHGALVDMREVEKLGFDHATLKQLARSVDETATVTPDGAVKFAFTPEGQAARERFVTALRAKARERGLEGMKTRAPDASDYKPKMGVDYRDPVNESFDGMTLQERIDAGETMNIGQRVAATVAAQERQLAAMDFFEYVSRGESGGVSFVSPEPPNSIVWESAPGGGARYVDASGVEWRQMPETGFGPLNGKAVRADIHAELMDGFDPKSRHAAVEFFQGAMSSWKAAKTILSVRTAMRQYLALPQLSGLAGVHILNPRNLPHWKNGIHAMVSDHPLHAEMKEWGIIRGGSYTDAELGELLRHVDDAGWSARTVGEALFAPWLATKRGRRFVKKAGQVYNFADEALRAAAYAKMRAKGATPSQASQYVSKWTPTLDDASRTTRAMSNTGSPFFRFQSELYRISGHAMLEHPVRFMNAALFSQQARWLAAAVGLSATMSGDEKEVFESEFHGDFVNVGRDDEGRVRMGDATWGTLYGQIFSGPDHTRLNESDFAGYAAELAGVNDQPLVSWMLNVVRGRDEFGREIATPSERESVAGKAAAAGKMTAKEFLPGLTPGVGRDWQRMEAAFRGEQFSPYLPQQAPMEAILSSLFGQTAIPMDADTLSDRVDMQDRAIGRETRRITRKMSDEDAGREWDSRDRAADEADRRIEAIEGMRRHQRRNRR